MSNWVLDRVSKNFDETTAINNITLEIEENKIYGLLGRNSAGKTTLLKLMANQLQPTNGVIKKGGEYLKDSDKLTQEICLARETININGIKNFSLKTIFRLASQVYPNWDNEYCQRLIKKFTLNIKQKYIKLSKGM